MNRFVRRQFSSLLGFAALVGICGCGTLDHGSDDPWNDDQVLEEVPDKRFEAGAFREF